MIFFSCVLLSACGEQKSEIAIIWKDENATGISIPKSLAKNISGTPEQTLAVRLVTEREPVTMLGNYKTGDDEILFEPLVPFTRGSLYEVLSQGQRIGEVKIPGPDPGTAPVLITIYPTQDTVPENLLKIYLHFSKPMREGVSAQHISLQKNNGEHVQGAFLDLQPELWNEDRTTLTIWLDPGRIKRDLKPNKLLGAPLKEGEHYTLTISDHWKDIHGSALQKSYSKDFVTTFRDSLSPDPKAWVIQTPKASTKDVLVIDLKTPLDFSLLNTTLRVVDNKGEVVQGKWVIGEEERSITFIPDVTWKVGEHELQVETRLEDLAGNNINRAFDVDVRRRGKEELTEEVSILFVCK